MHTSVRRRGILFPPARWRGGWRAKRAGWGDFCWLGARIVPPTPPAFALPMRKPLPVNGREGIATELCASLGAAGRRRRSVRAALLRWRGRRHRVLEARPLGMLGVIGRQVLVALQHLGAFRRPVH